MVSFNSVFALIGAAWTSFLGLKLLRFVYIYTRPSSLQRYHHKDGDKSPWALVTGASDGIGRGFAQEPAHRGFNVTLHGRNPPKLDGVRAQLIRDYPPAELQHYQIDKIVQSLRDVHLAVLINNVGGPPPLMQFDDNTASDIDGMMATSNRFTTQLASAILPLLLSHQLSLIMNIGSAADVGMPRLSTYSGARSFIMAWTRAARQRDEGRKRKCGSARHFAGYCDVGFPPQGADFLFLPDARTFAAASLDRVGCGENGSDGILDPCNHEGGYRSLTGILTFETFS